MFVPVVRREPSDDVAVVRPRAVPEPQHAVPAARDQGPGARGEKCTDCAARAGGDAGRGEVGGQGRRGLRGRRRGRRRRWRKPVQRHRHGAAGRRRPQHEPGGSLGDLPQRSLPSSCAPDKRARWRRRSGGNIRRRGGKATATDQPLPRRRCDRQRVDARRPRQPPRRNPDQEPGVPQRQDAARGASDDPRGAQGVGHDGSDGTFAGGRGEDPGIERRRRRR